MIVLIAVEAFIDHESIFETFKGIKEKSPEKPLIAVGLIGDKHTYDTLFRSFKNLGIPLYTSVERAIMALSALTRYSQRKKLI